MGRREPTTWALVATNLLMTATFGLLAAVLVRNAERIDAGSGAVRWIRRVFAADLAVLATGYLLVSVAGSEAFGAVAGIAFLVMFVLGAVLGGVLLRRPDVRVPAALMVAPIRSSGSPSPSRRSRRAGATRATRRPRCTSASPCSASRSAGAAPRTGRERSRAAG